MKHMQQAVVPVQVEMLLRNLPNSFYHEPNHIQEVRLAHRHLVWVDVRLLESRVEQLTDGHVVAVRRIHANVYSQALKQRQRAFVI